ncbi:MAG TPA: hypothetical protein VFG23_16910 [Polyangia bacterium]|nr:hypothetical protein [Polyangia bacterium]
MPPGSLNYGEAEFRRIRELGGGPFEVPEDLRRVLDGIGYLEDWRKAYRVQSVKASLHSEKITCIDSAILAYGLLELLFGDVKRRLLAIHRRDPVSGEEVGHCVALHWNDAGKVGSFAKSNYPGLGHRDAIFEDETAIAASYAQVYLKMGYQPLYFGVTTLEECAPDIDWRYSPDELNVISARIQEHYEYSFMLAT